jgi:tetratricopeptide (TPR) repeat protein
VFKGHGQNAVLDSLRAALKTSGNDTAKALIYLEIGEQLLGQFPDTASIYWEKTKNICVQSIESGKWSGIELKAFKKYYAASLNNLAYMDQMRGNIDQALADNLAALKLQQEVGDKIAEAASLGNIGYIYLHTGDSKKALEYFQKGFTILQETGDKFGMAHLIASIGAIHQTEGRYAEAIAQYEKSMELFKEIQYNNGIANMLNNLASAYSDLGNVNKSLEYYSRCLKLIDETTDEKGEKNKRGASACLSSMAGLYKDQGDVQKAIEYQERSLKIRRDIKDMEGVAISLNAMGDNFLALKEFDRSLPYYEESLEIYRQIKNPQGLSACLNALGRVYEIKGDLAKAIVYLNESLKTGEGIKYKVGIVGSLNNIAEVYYKEKKYDQALSSAIRAYSIGREIKAAGFLRNCCGVITRIHRTLGNYREALKYFEEFVQLGDSLNNEKTKKASIKSQLKYEYEKQAAADSVVHAKESEIKNAELKRQSAEIKAKKNQQVALFGGLALVIIFAAFMFNRFKVTQKQKVLIEHQKEIVEEQKKLVEEKQHEILDSIRYAKRIQLAQIPTEKRVAQILSRLKHYVG